MVVVPDAQATWGSGGVTGHCSPARPRSRHGDAKHVCQMLGEERPPPPEVPQVQATPQADRESKRKGSDHFVRSPIQREAGDDCQAQPGERQNQAPVVHLPGPPLPLGQPDGHSDEEPAKSDRHHVRKAPTWTHERLHDDERDTQDAERACVGP